MPEYVELQAIVASLYALQEQELAHILSTFPLVAPEVRTAVLGRFGLLRHEKSSDGPIVPHGSALLEDRSNQE
jgi:hypothetical protein